MITNKYGIGIDIGTTSVKISVLDYATLGVVQEWSKCTNADIINDGIRNEQDVKKIAEAIDDCVSKISLEILQKVASIGVCGQEHGILFWSSDNKPWKESGKNDATNLTIDSENVSHLYTWQDGRCNAEFLSSLPEADSHLKAYTGYGCNTLFWLHRNSYSEIERFNCAGSVMDFFVALLCDLDVPVMSNQNAASWGYFNTDLLQWNKEILQAAEFPIFFLPPVYPPEKIAGVLSRKWHDIPVGTPIGIGLGDSKCSVLAVMENDTDAVINISTSAQVIYIQDVSCVKGESGKTIVENPYFNGKYMTTAASLNGGNTLASFVRGIHKYIQQIGCNLPEDELWKHLISNNDDDNNLVVIPTLRGERCNPNQKGAILNITPDNIAPTKIFKAICHGLINNLHSMMSRDVLISAGIKRIVATGSALTRNPVLQDQVRKCYQLPMIVKNSADSSYGAAIAVMNILNK